MKMVKFTQSNKKILYLSALFSVLLLVLIWGTMTFVNVDNMFLGDLKKIVVTDNSTGKSITIDNPESMEKVSSVFFPKIGSGVTTAEGTDIIITFNYERKVIQYNFFVRKNDYTDFYKYSSIDKPMSYNFSKNDSKILEEVIKFTP
ncbi:MAG: hypothetical protein CVU85_08225 [Firmicutes bacterium HGW-Firmicutes-10]|jgi:hypothetical protein|nr:MAG: hypothetical protein CVU85_08225 [Firmicutes bacterium HGW-Firmicutes-10]